MILHALNGDVGWSVYDSKRCCEVVGVQWVNSDTAQWGQIRMITMFGLVVDVDTVPIQEERITIYPDRMLVIFNEVADNTDQTVEKEIAKIA